MTVESNEQPPQIQLLESELQAAVHESEPSLAMLAIVGIAPVAIFAVILSAVTFLMLPLVLIAAMLFFGRIVEATLRGNAVEVGADNFPEIAEDVAVVSRRLGYEKPVQAFIIQEGEINAVLWRVFGRKFIGLNSELVKTMSDGERRFIIGRFIGALRARHLRFHEASSIIGSFEKLKGLNLLVLPYLRASVYTGDRFGALAVGEPSVALSAMDKLLIGDKLADQLSAEGVKAQAARLRSSPFRTLSILFSAHPHMTDRYLELHTYFAGVAPAGREASQPPNVAANAA